MKIPKTPYPIFACRFSCDYANDGELLLSIHGIQVRKNTERKVIDIIHPGDAVFGVTDTGILQGLQSQVLKYRKNKGVYAVQDRTILRTLLGLDSLRVDAIHDDEGSFEYSPLGDHFGNGIIGDIGFFASHGIELITGRDQELLDIFQGK